VVVRAGLSEQVTLSRDLKEDRACRVEGGMKEAL
jgi:hypothetical protein